VINWKALPFGRPTKFSSAPAVMDLFLNFILLPFMQIIIN